MELLAENGIGEVTRTGWVAPEGMTFDEWVSIGSTLQTIGSSINWWVGDWLNYGEAKWGEMYAQAIEVTGWEYGRLSNCKRVAEHIPFSMRIENLSWTHHWHVASLPPDEQASFLEMAEAEGWTSRELKEAVAQAKRLPGSDEAEKEVKLGGYLPEDARAEMDGWEDVPFSGSGHNNGDAPDAVLEYEERTERWYDESDDELPTLSWSATEQVRGLVRCVLAGEWGEAMVLAGELRWLAEDGSVPVAGTGT